MKMKKTFVITVCQRKGGVGKSTSTLNIAFVLAFYGFKVLIVDLDDQQNTTRTISGLVNNNTDGSLKAGKTIEDVLLKDDVFLNDAVVETSWTNVWILPSSSNLSGVVKHLNGELGGHLILKEKLFDPRHDFDFILIDTSPSLDILVINALCASNHMFIPLNSKYFSMQGLNQTLSSFTKVKSRLNPDLSLLGIAFVNHDKRNTLANEVVSHVLKQYEKDVFKTIIGINIKIEEAQVKKQSILTYAPDDRGSKQYIDLGSEILDRISKNEI